jgi:tryptophan halogenase
VRLLRFFPFRGINEVDVLNYNKESIFEIERIRDFIILHYKVTDRRDSAFWRDCANMDVPEQLQNKIDAFTQTGRVNVDSGEMFGDSWAQVMFGQGLMPNQYHPLMKTFNEPQIAEFMREISNRIEGSLYKLADHAAYVKRYCETAPINQQH